MRTRVLTTGLAMGESPRWHDGRLWLCDWLAGEVLTIDGAGRREVVHRIEGLPVSIDWLPDGREVCTTPRGVVVGPDLAAYGGTGRPWNEIVVDPRGRVFVNMPGSAPGEDPRPGILAVIEPDGTTREVADDLWFPNGMALTPDGICLDAEGAIWYADVPHRHCRRVAEGGRVLDTVEVDRGCFACMLGGPDGRTLHIVATDWERLDWQHGGGERTGQVLTARAPAPHAGHP